MTSHGGIERSVMERIARRAREIQVEPNALLTRFVTERFLARLSRSRHAGRFVLKGAMLMPLWLGDTARSTRDADLAGHGEITPDALVEIFRDVFHTQVDPDGIAFNEGSIRVTEIREGDAYGGYRINAISSIGPSRIVLQVDVGIGDAISPPPELVNLPPVLDFPAPRLRAYRPETSIAEKFHVITTMGRVNSRMKDYYDIERLAAELTFEGSTLRKAIEKTFARRGERLPAEVPDGLTDAFASSSDKQTQWSAFARRLGSRSSLQEVVERVRSFVMPVVTVTVVHWKPGGPWEVGRKR